MNDQNDNNPTSTQFDDLNLDVQYTDDSGKVTVPDPITISTPSDNAASGQPVTPPAPQQSDVTTPNTNSVTPTDSIDNLENLINIKKKAIHELSPLIQKLDQPPADKFKTIMMMIQAADEQTLIPSAYDTALAIEDETEKAQALFDVVSEINYFTQKQAA